MKLPLFSVLATVAVGACANSGGGGSPFDETDAGKVVDSGNGDVFVPPIGTVDSGPDDDNTKDYEDLPKDPIVDSTGPLAIPINAATHFAGGPVTADPGPCVMEPEIGSRVPRNWVRPRFSYKAPAGNIFQIKVSAENQKNPLVVITSNPRWTMPVDLWDKLRRHSWDRKMNLTVKSATFNGTLGPVATGSSGEIGILPVSAPGSIVYFAAKGDVGALRGFRIGDESTVSALQPSEVKQRVAGCIGCHSPTPDGTFVIASGNYGGGGVNKAIFGAQIDPSGAGVGAMFPFLSSVARSKMDNRVGGMSAMTKAHWSAGDHIVVTSFDNATLEALNLDTGTSKVLGHTGDIRRPVAPTWTKDGQTIFYTSSETLDDGRPNTGAADIIGIPYNDGAGGVAVPLVGASDPNRSEYYPSLSPDDAYVGFTRLDVNGYMTSAPNAEILVVPRAGGTATRLPVNDPPTCSGLVSPGVSNSWPKWAPDAVKYKQKTYYFIVFSSTRLNGRAQLYMTSMAVDAVGNMETYRGVYLWNQEEDAGNHSPGWDNFVFPNVPK